VLEIPVPEIPRASLEPPSGRDPAFLLLEARALAIRSERLPAPFELLRASAVPKRAPGALDWLAQHEERGQSFGAFRAAQPKLPGRTLYLVAAGPIGAAHRELTRELALLLSAFFQLEVKWLPAIPDEIANAKARAGYLGPQYLTHTIMDALEPRRPRDGVALMAVTQVDLYPHPSWNFVYGQARYGKRVGVMSMARDGDPATERAQILRRAFSTAAHEIGHMFGIHHCIAWECGMNGRNHRLEADQAPLEPCPACLAKLHLAIGFDPERRWRELAKQYARVGLGADAFAVTAALRASRSAR
jgi:archaemetzincin